MKIKLSRYNPIKPDLATIEVSTLIKRITLESLEICLSTFAIHVMKDDILLDCLKIKVALTRRRETREDIMLMLQKMMNLPRRETDKSVMILQVMKNMFRFPLSWELSHKAMIGV